MKVTKFTANDIGKAIITISVEVIIIRLEFLRICLNHTQITNETMPNIRRIEIIILKLELSIIFGS